MALDRSTEADHDDQNSHKADSADAKSRGAAPQDPGASASIGLDEEGHKKKLPRQLGRPSAVLIFTALFVLTWLCLLTASQFDKYSACRRDIPIPVPQYTTPITIPDPISQPKMSTEQTFIAIKPDGVQRGLVAPIISRFEQRGFKLVAIKMVTPTQEHLENHYSDLKEKPFFPGLIKYMLSGPIVAMVWEGRDAVKTGRVLLGATNPLASAPGTIRGDFAIDVGRNICHGSDAVESAQKEIALWFSPEEVKSWKSHSFDWVYEKA